MNGQYRSAGAESTLIYASCMAPSHAPRRVARAVAAVLVAAALLAAGWWIGSRPDDQQAGAVATANIGNFVWNDLNRDGVQDAGEPPVVGVTVEAWDAARTTFVGSAVTNASGNYVIPVPVSATYTFRVVFPPGTTASPQDASGVDTTDSDADPTGFTAGVAIASNIISISNVDFGLVAGSGYWPVGPTRLLDTRNGTLDGFNQVGKRTAGSTLTLKVVGRAGVTGAAKVVTLNLTALQGEAQGFVTAYPCGGSLPTTSSLNFGAGQPPIANEVQVAVGANGTVCLFTSANVHLLADISGATIG